MKNLLTLFLVVLLTGTSSMSFSQEEDPRTIVRWADQWHKKDRFVVSEDYGLHAIHNTDKILRPNWVIYQFNIVEEGEYWIRIEYASLDPRPVHISGDYHGKEVIEASALGSGTGGWREPHFAWETVGSHYYKKGTNYLRIHRSNPIPHIRKIRIEKKTE